MADSRSSALLDYIRGQLAAAEADALSDRELLRRFAAHQDEPAFKILLRRHGPMVLNVCQRVLERKEDAEDVFQATFLVLARKAGALRWRESISAWLYEVAHRLAREARRKQLRQQARESRAQTRSVEDPLSEISGRELLSILDEALASLPERYRAPLLLCCLEGKSGDEAARDLHCSPSTIKRRLQEARERLREQLGRRGFPLSLAAVSALLLHGTSRAGVPEKLINGTLRAALLTGAGERVTTGLVSATAVALSKGIGAPVHLNQIILGLVMILAVSGGMTGLAVLAHREPPTTPAPLASGEGRFLERAVEIGELLQGPPPRSGAPVTAMVETTLPTAGGQIRQFAFDANADTWFASAKHADATDHFTLVFDMPVTVQSIRVTTGRPDGEDRLDRGTLEVSVDGRRFEPVGTFVRGRAQARLAQRWVQAIRVRPTAELGHALALREFVIDAQPPVQTFRYPIEISVNANEAPELKEWAERAARVCERVYPMISDELPGAGFKPPQVITMTLRNDYQGVAQVNNERMTLSPKYFKTNPDDLGALVHVTSYVVQHYRNRNNPKWLVGGIADYVRYFKYEPGKLGPIDPERARYNGRFKETAAFLSYLTENYDKNIVRKLNQILRDGEYRDEAFQELTGRSVLELDEEWRASLRSALAGAAEP